MSEPPAIPLVGILATLLLRPIRIILVVLAIAAVPQAALHVRRERKAKLRREPRQGGNDPAR